MNLTETEIEDMHLAPLRKFSTQYTKYHDMNLQVRNLKRLELQLHLGNWRSELINAKEEREKAKENEKNSNEIKLPILDEINHIEHLKNFKKRDLVAYLYFNSKGSDIVEHETLYSTKSDNYIQKQVMKSLEFSRTHKSEILSVEDTLAYIILSSIEDDEAMDVPFLQMHVRNWYLHKKEALPYTFSGDCKSLLVGILDDAREELPQGKPFVMDPGTIAYVNSSFDVDKDGDQIMKEPKGIEKPTAVTPPKKRKLVQNEGMAMDKNEKNREEDTTPESTKVKPPRTDLPLVNITAEVTDEELENAQMDQLQSAFHSYSISSGEEISRSTINEWEREFLHEVCVTKRNNLKIQKRLSKQQPKSALRKTTKMRQTSLLHPNKTKGTCRYSLHFTIPSTYKGTEGLRQFLSLIFMEMKKYGTDLCLLPWATDEIVNSISDVEKLPTTITGITKYFDGARSPEASTQLFMKIRLGYSLQMEKVNFDADVQGWCKAQSIRLYQCSVQHPNVRSCGWLVYAPRSMNQQKWCQQVVKMYEAKFNTKDREPFQVGLTWRALNGQYKIPTKDKVRAMHIDAPVEVASRVKNFLRLLAQKKKWPMHVRFRVMDEYNKFMKESTKQKYRYMVAKHTSLLAQLGQCECSQIVNLDRQISGSKMTLRDVILNVRDKQDGHRIFGSIDEKWNSDTLFIATYRPDKSTKAYDFVRSLSTYVKYLFPDGNFKRILTPQAIDKANDESYNPSSQTFTTQDDIDLDKEIQADLDDDSMDFAAPDDLTNPFEFDDSVRLVGGDSVWDLNGDADTVSTNQPSGMGNVSFDSATCRMYDSSSCASSVSSMPNTKRMTKTSTLSDSISEEINDLKAASTDIDNDAEEAAEEK